MMETISSVSDPLIWLAIATFLVAAVFEVTGRRHIAVYVASGAWAMFGIFWMTMVPYFAFEVRSPIETVLSLVALPLCLYTGYLLFSGRDSLLLLSRAVGIMGLIYLPAAAYEPVTRILIESVTVQTHWGMELLGYDPGITEGPNGYASMFAFEGYTTYIVLACTGIGSIAIFGGLIAAVNAPLKRKMIAFGITVGVIWFLNLARNVFVGLAAPLGWFDYPLLESLTVMIVGSGFRTSFFISHHVISQSLSVVALIGITVVIIRIVPELLTILEEVVFILTGSDYDLNDAFGTASNTGEARQQ